MKATNIAGALNAKEWDRERIMDAQAQYFVLTGEIEVSEPGESLVSVNFPILFVDKPKFSYGSQLHAGLPLVAGSFPAVTCSVANWGERIRDDGTVIYSGAIFAVVANGPDGQVVDVHWHMEGVGLRGPTPSNG